jgi:hypothetical protein
MSSRDALILFVLVAFGASCGRRTPGELILAIDSDLTPGGDRPDFDALQINVTNDNFTTQKFTEFGAPDLPTTFPATFALVSDGDPKLDVHLRIYVGLAGKGVTPVGDPQILREFASVIPTDRAALLRIHLEWACIGNAYDKGPPDHYVESRCPEGSTCIAGTCVKWDVDSTTLPTYDSRALSSGACFDTIRCLSQGSTVAIDRMTCTMSRPSDLGPNTNIGIVSSDGHGICAPNGTCYVPLDAASAIGWMDTGSRIALPQGFCQPGDGISPNRIGAIVLSSTCPSKTETLPTCGPWFP